MPRIVVRGTLRSFSTRARSPSSPSSLRVSGALPESSCLCMHRGNSKLRTRGLLETEVPTFALASAAKLCTTASLPCPSFTSCARDRKVWSEMCSMMLAAARRFSQRTTSSTGRPSEQRSMRSFSDNSGAVEITTTSCESGRYAKPERVSGENTTGTESFKATRCMAYADCHGARSRKALNSPAEHGHQVARAGCPNVLPEPLEVQ
ncbi:hypothetical protein BV20DRAFT_779947 [Pilatotrama ljubarskyi]|nr:hypothetical protein BV20DRAFT_779947 [Pilatotrama ljubarskyi]